MTENKHSNANQERRERIMNSDKQLPGDKDRMRDEENEDFDGTASSLGGRAGGPAKDDPTRREEVNESEGQLPGDLQREADDKRVDESIHSSKKKD